MTHVAVQELDRLILAEGWEPGLGRISAEKFAGLTCRLCKYEIDPSDIFVFTGTMEFHQDCYRLYAKRVRYLHDQDAC